MIARRAGRFALVITVMALSACALVPTATPADPRQLPGDDAAGGDGTQLGGGNTASGPGLPVEEAIDTTLDEILLVRGFLVARDGDVRLCSALAESFPPQCAGERLTVVELDLATVDDELTTAQGVTWSEQPIQLAGRVNGDVMTVEPDTSGAVPGTDGA